MTRSINACIVRHLLTTTILVSTATVTFAEPIHLQPGQCILVGSQQVCALKTDATEASASPPALYVCRYGMHKDSEVPDLKSYSLVQISTSTLGVKSEVHLKNFGQNGKAACEQEAEAKSK